MEELTTKPVILIVEDDPVLQELCLDAFGVAGFTVLQARDGEQAVEIAKEHPEVQVMLIDIMLPKLSGFEVIKQIRTIALDRDTPIIIFSALGTEDDRKHGLEAGATVYLSKGDTPLKDVIETAKKYTG